MTIGTIGPATPHHTGVGLYGVLETQVLGEVYSAIPHASASTEQTVDQMLGISATTAHTTGVDLHPRTLGLVDQFTTMTERGITARHMLDRMTAPGYFDEELVKEVMSAWQWK